MLMVLFRGCSFTGVALRFATVKRYRDIVHHHGFLFGHHFLTIDEAHASTYLNTFGVRDE
jgi:hypothetical protein